MKENLIIKKYRGSIFLTQDIASDKELIKELSELLGISQATIVEKTPQDPPEKDVIALKEWNYISPDNRLQINFQAQKIDVEQKIATEYSIESITSFAQLCIKIFVFILKLRPQNISRLAIAPTLKFTGDIRLLISKVNSFYSKNDFLGCQNDKLDFSQVYRRSELLDSKKININYFSKFFINNEIAIEEGKLKILNEILLNFDINTTVGDEYIFAQEDIKDFFKKSPDFCNNFINYYFCD